MTVKINIENRTIARVVFVVVFTLLALKFLTAVSHAILLIVIAAFLAIALNPPVNYLASRITGGSRAGATGIAYLIVITVILLFLWALIPPLINQTGQFLDNIPEYVDQLKDGDNFVSRAVERYDLDQEIEDFGSSLSNDLSDTSGTVIASITKIGAAIVNILTVFVLTFFMIVEGPSWLQKMWDLTPEEKRAHRQKLAQQMYHVITGYVNGQLLIALLASLSSLVFMLMPFIQMPFALPLAGLVGLFGLIPMVGATLGSVVVIIVALFKSVGVAIAMAAFFLIYQQIENNVIQPYVQSRALNVSPLLILIAVIFGISMGGIIGGFIAIPMAAILRILLLDFLEHREEASHKSKPKTPKPKPA